MVGVFIVLILIPEATRWLPEVPNRPDLFPAIRNIVSGLLILAVLRWRPRGILPEPHRKDLKLEKSAVARERSLQGSGGESGQH